VAVSSTRLVLQSRKTTFESVSSKYTSTKRRKTGKLRDWERGMIPELLVSRSRKILRVSILWGLEAELMQTKARKTILL